MERYFHGPVPESVQSAAHALGLSGGAGSSCVSHLHAAMRSHAHSRSSLHGLEAIAAFAFRTLWRCIDCRNCLWKNFCPISFTKSYEISFCSNSIWTSLHKPWRDLEMDGTRLPKWRQHSSGLNVYAQLFGVYQRGSSGCTDEDLYQVLVKLNDTCPLYVYVYVIYIYTYIFKFIYIYIYIFIHLYTYIYVYIYIYLKIQICIYIYIHL